MNKLLKSIASLFAAAAMTVGTLGSSVSAYDVPEAVQYDEAVVSAPVYHTGVSGKPVGDVARPEGHRAPAELAASAEPLAPSRDEAIQDGYTYSGKYVYEHLNTDRQREFYRGMKASCEEFAASGKDAKDYIKDGSTKLYYLTPVSYEGMTLDEAIDTWILFIYSEPQYYFISLAYYFSDLEYDDSELFWPCILNGMVKASQRAKVEAAINKTVDEWLPEIEAQVTVTAKELKITQLMCKNITYDFAALKAMDAGRSDGYDQNIIGAFYEHSCVCAGYAQAASFLCNAAGIESFCVTSMEHQWNVVKLYDNWYQLDVTWMDTDEEEPEYLWCNKSYDTFQKQDTDGYHKYEELWDRYEMPASVYDEVKVPDLGLVGVRITTQPVKTVYAMGDPLDMTGGVLTAYYADSKSGEYTEQIPLTSESVTVSGNTDTAGNKQVVIGLGGLTVSLPVIVYDPVAGNVNVVTGGEFESFDTLGKAFTSIDKKKDKNAEYVVTVNRKIFEDKIKFPTVAKRIELAANGDAVITTNSAAIALSSDTVIGCPIVNASKKINYTVAKNKTLTVTADIAAGTIKGGSGSSLSIAGNVTAAGISTFAKADIGGSLTLTGKSTGIGALSGKLILATGSSAVIDSIGDANVVLAASAGANGAVTVPKLTVTRVTAPLVIDVDAEALPSSGTTVMYAANVKKFEGAENIRFTDTDADGNELSPVMYGKEIRAEYEKALMLTVETQSGTDVIYAPTFEKIFELLAGVGADAVCTVDVSGETVCGKFKLPAKLGGFTIRGGTVTIPGGSVSVKYPLTFSDTQINAVDKKGSPAVLTIKTTGTLTLENTVINAKDINLKGSKIIMK